MASDLISSMFRNHLPITVDVGKSVRKVVAESISCLLWTKGCSIVRPFSDCIFSKTNRKVFYNTFGKAFGRMSDVLSTANAHKVLWNIELGVQRQLNLGLEDIKTSFSIPPWRAPVDYNYRLLLLAFVQRFSIIYLERNHTKCIFLSDFSWFHSLVAGGDE